MHSSFKIPERISSKRGLAEMEGDKARIEVEIERESKKVKATGSFDSRFWTQLGDVSELRRKKSELSLSILRDGVRDGTAWEDNDEAKRLREEERCHSLESNIFKKQASRLDVNPGDEAKNRRGFFMTLWTTSTKGLGITGTEIGRGDRSRSIQKHFRDSLIEACGSRHPDPRSDELWCPVLGHFFPDDQTMHAAHVFPWADGQSAMDEIFGREVKNVEELNGIQNGLMLSRCAEKRLEDGDIVIVPDVAENASAEEIDRWSNSDPKEYKVRVTNPTAKGMNMWHPGNVHPRKTWNDLDGRKVQFSSEHRPRARYLYWQYCKTILKHAWTDKGMNAKKILMKERGKHFWGTKGPYMKKRMLLAFVEQLGHDHEALLENALVETKEDEISESDPSALLLASQEIRGVHRERGEEEEGGDGDYSKDDFF